MGVGVGKAEGIRHQREVLSAGRSKPGVGRPLQTQVQVRQRPGSRLD